MKGDFTRFSHQPRMGYAGVLLQQGRVTLDADWNEQVAITDHRLRAQAADTIGGACAPADAAGFGVTFTPDGRDLIISPGRMYIDGLLVELFDQTTVYATFVDDTTVAVNDVAPDGEQFAVGQWVEVDSTDDAGAAAHTITRVTAVDGEAAQLTLDPDVSAHAGHAELRVRRLTTYLTQPYYPADDPTFGDAFTPENWNAQTHIVYLDVWRRHVTAIEDPHLREVALGGPDTATRTQTAWAVRILRGSDGAPVDAAGVDCDDPHPAWDALVAPSGGRMWARAEAAPDPEDPCAIAPEAGYRGVENRLYRVEIHEPGDLGTATFKWSRDNGSVLAAVTEIESGDTLHVTSLGRDRVLRFGTGDRVEVFGEGSELSGVPGTVASISDAPDEAERSFPVDTDVSAYDADPLPRVRRWDHGVTEPVATDAWVELEDGVQVRFAGGPFHVGDHWVVPARVATGDVDGFVDAPPLGITHHHTRVALITWPTDTASGEVDDCRSTFPSLCEIDAGCCTITVGEDGDHTDLQDAVDAADDIDGPVRICLLPGEHVVPITVVVRRGDLTISGCGQQSRVFSELGGVLLFLGTGTVRLEDLWLASSGLWPTVGALGTVRLEIVDCQIANVRMGEQPTERPPGTVPERPQGGMFEPPPADAATKDAARLRSRLTKTDPFAMPATGAAPTDPTTLPPGGPAVVVSRSGGMLVDRCVLIGAPAVTFDGVLGWVEHTVMRGGGVWLRDGTSRAAVRGNTIVAGLGNGVLLGGLFPGEKPQQRLAGVVGVAIADNHIEAMTHEGVGTLREARLLTGEVEDVVVSGNTIRTCGWFAGSDELAAGGGILLRDATQVRIDGNTIDGNGPAGAVARIRMAFGVLAVSCQSVEVHGNAITDNGAVGALDDENVLTLNGGVVALGTAGGDLGLDARLPVLAEPAVTVRDNTIVTPEGPGVFLHGVGPMAVTDNTVASAYGGTLQWRVGRAIAVLNLGVAPDLGLVRLLATGGDERARAFHGPVTIDGNQISVQGDARGLPARNPDVTPEESPPYALVTGSAVFAMTFDDVGVDGNQIVNEILPLGEAFLRLQSSVAAFGTTARTTGNRVTELPATALRSYVGAAIAHVAADNVTTHCIRVDGTRVREHDNIELLCPDRRGEVRHHVILGR